MVIGQDFNQPRELYIQIQLIRYTIKKTLN